MQPTVRDYMTTPVVTVRRDAPLHEADDLLSEGVLTAVAVTDADDRPVGVLSNTDLFARAKKHTLSGALELPAATAGELMTDHVIAVAPDADLAEACVEMIERRVHRVFVIDGEQLVGVVSTHDVLEAVANQRVATPLAALMTPQVRTVQAYEGIGIATSQLERAGIHALVVLDDQWPVGTISQDELLLARDWPDDTAIESWMNLRMLSLPQSMPAFRAAAHALAMNARHVLAMSDNGLEGIVSDIDFARALVGALRDGAGA